MARKSSNDTDAKPLGAAAQGFNSRLTGFLDSETFKTSKAETLARHLETQIVSEALSPGHRLGTKEEVRSRFGVAVATVNEAVRLLETRGLVVARPGPGGGLFVAKPSAHIRMSHVLLGFKSGVSTFSECLEVRAALEPLVLRDASQNAHAADLRSFREHVTTMGLYTDQPAPYLAAAWSLHRRIAAACSNVVLRSIYLTLLDYVREGLVDVKPFEFDGPRDLAVHEELIEAVALGQSKRLEAAIERHAETLRGDSVPPSPGLPRNGRRTERRPRSRTRAASTK